MSYLLDVLKVPGSYLIGDNACLYGDIDVLHYLLKHKHRENMNSNGNVVSYKGVLNAASRGHLEILRLLNRHYNLHSTEALYLAMCSKHKHIVDWYVLSQEVVGCHGLVPSSMVYSALVYYIELGDVDTSLQLLKANPTMLCIQKRSTKVVDMCASTGNLALLKVLFAYKGRESHNALDKAAANGHLEVVRYLTGYSGRTTLHPTLDELHRSNDSTNSLNSSLNSSLGTHLGSEGQLHTPRLVLHSNPNSSSNMNMTVTVNQALPRGPGHYLIDPSNNISLLHSRTPTPSGSSGNDTETPVPVDKGQYTIHATKNAITLACCNGHIDVVEYLLFNRFEGRIYPVIYGSICI